MAMAHLLQKLSSLYGMGLFPTASEGAVAMSLENLRTSE